MNLNKDWKKFQTFPPLSEFIIIIIIIGIINY